MAVPRVQTKSQVADSEPLEIIDVARTNCEVVRFWDNVVPLSGRPNAEDYPFDATRANARVRARENDCAGVVERERLRLAACRNGSENCGDGSRPFSFGGSRASAAASSLFFRYVMPSNTKRLRL